MFGYVMCGLCRTASETAGKESPGTRIPGVNLRSPRRDHRCPWAWQPMSCAGWSKSRDFHAAPHTETTVLDKRTRIPDGARPQTAAAAVAAVFVDVVPLPQRQVWLGLRVSSPWPPGCDLGTSRRLPQSRETRHRTTSMEHDLGRDRGATNLVAFVNLRRSAQEKQIWRPHSQQRLDPNTRSRGAV